MSTAASSSASPTVVRSHSTSSRPQTHRPPSSDLPHRTKSVAVRPSTASQPSQPPHQPQHLQSPAQFRTQAYERHPPPSNKAVFDNLARRDPEAARGNHPPPTRRSYSRERSQERAAAYHSDTAPKRHQRNLSVQGHQRDSIDMATAGSGTAGSATAEGSSGPPQAGSGAQVHAAASAAPKRRTMITTPSGQWALGKTIGAGSMGKVKLAKNLETGEQVSSFSLAQEARLT